MEKIQSQTGSRNAKNGPYIIGFMFSLVLHLAGGFLVIFLLESAAARAAKAPQVFTVTLEGGTNIGGVSQIPKKNKKPDKVLTPPEKVEEEPEPDPAEEAKAAKLKEAAVLQEKKRKAEEEEKKKKALEAKKKKEAEKKKKELAKKKVADEKKARERRLKQAIEKAKKNRYSGESANAGGSGFGAASLGGKGMGGGTLASAEFIAYMNALEHHIKSSWRWGLPAKRVLTAQVLMQILPNGVVKSAKISASSGNQKFDDSVLRAVYKSSPVPPAPPKLYERFREVRITFDSRDR